MKSLRQISTYIRIQKWKGGTFAKKFARILEAVSMRHSSRNDQKVQMGRKPDAQRSQEAASKCAHKIIAPDLRRRLGRCQDFSWKRDKESGVRITPTSLTQHHARLNAAVYAIENHESVDRRTPDEFANLRSAQP
jgi:hypothetical protein